MSEVIIRLIEKKDNLTVKAIVQKVILELGAPKIGTAYADPSLECMYETYQKHKAAYFVVVYQDTIIGGAGVAQLENYTGNVCELQKMYFLPEARGKGIGTTMMQKCLEAAKNFGYEQCYLETMTYMKAAQKLYQRSGFIHIDAPLGNTGHFSCPVHMIKTL